MFAPLQRRTHQRLMGCGRRGYHDPIQRRVRKDRFECHRRRPIAAGHVGEDCRVIIADRRQRSQRVKITHQILAPIAAADDCDPGDVARGCAVHLRLGTHGVTWLASLPA